MNLSTSEESLNMGKDSNELGTETTTGCSHCRG
jgi:hypothetical protein